MPLREFSYADKQAQARLAIELRVAGRTEAEISDAVNDAPRPGTGRNHPRNVAFRSGFAS